MEVYRLVSDGRPLGSYLRGDNGHHDYRGSAEWVLLDDHKAETARLRAELEAVKAERDEARATLGAWREGFGTSQLTHALARLGKAEEDASLYRNGYEEGLEQVGFLRAERDGLAAKVAGVKEAAEAVAHYRVLESFFGDAKFVCHESCPRCAIDRALSGVEVLAVVDARVGVEGRTTMYHCIKVPVDLAFDTPVRVIVLRKEG